MRRIARQLSSSSTVIGRTINGRGSNLKRTKSSDDTLQAILNNEKVIFTVTFNCNDDGGKQEFNTAVDCIRAVFPGGEVIENAISHKNNNENDPTQQTADVVTITAEVMLRDYEEEEDDDNDANNETIPILVWTGLQSNLLKRNSQERTTAIKEIKDGLHELIDELAED